MRAGLEGNSVLHAVRARWRSTAGLRLGQSVPPPSLKALRTPRCRNPQAPGSYKHQWQHTLTVPRLSTPPKTSQASTRVEFARRPCRCSDRGCVTSRPDPLSSLTPPSHHQHAPSARALSVRRVQAHTTWNTPRAQTRCNRRRCRSAQARASFRETRQAQPTRPSRFLSLRCSSQPALSMSQRRC